MRCECPQLRRCCLCLPLRFGLIVLACIKLVLDVICLMNVAYIINLTDDQGIAVFPIILMSVATVLVVVDLVFNGVLMRGYHKKNTVLLHVFYRYSLFLLGLNIVFLVGIIILDIVIRVKSPFVWAFTLPSVFIFVMFFVLSSILHIYMSILVRSEVQKLEAKARFQFTNTTANVTSTIAIKHPYSDTHPASDGPDKV